LGTDEATSALDATSRVLVFEAIKRWRQNKTTVVITHDLSQINSNDFVYVLKGGQVVEQGYRYDLETNNRGDFRVMMDTQGAMGGFLPVRVESRVEKESPLDGPPFFDTMDLRRSRPDSRLVPWGSGIFGNAPEPTPTGYDPSRWSRFVPPEWFAKGIPLVETDHEFDAEKLALKKSGFEASRRRPDITKSRTRLDPARHSPLEVVKIEEPPEVDKPQSFWSLIRDIYPTVPYKSIVLLGIIVCLLNGTMTPVFSFLLSRLMFEVSTGAHHSSVINLFGGIVLGIAGMDGIFIGLKHFIMDTSAACWVSNLRKLSYRLILAQDKKWFDKTENSPVRLVQILIKDGDDAGNLVAVVLGQSFVVAALLGVGLVWALIKGWQLTLVGFAIVPVFAVAMAVQTNLATRCEVRNKRAKEEVAKAYYQVLPYFHSFFVLLTVRRPSPMYGRSAQWHSKAFSKVNSTVPLTMHFGWVGGARS